MKTTYRWLLPLLFPFLIWSENALSQPLCTPFKVHLHATLPPPPFITVPKTLPQNWEEETAKLIGEVKTQENFPEIYKLWLKQHPSALSKEQRYQWLQCVLYYVKMDTNGNGIPDWTAIVDNQPAQVLFPEDPDMDGDGVPNVLDPSPLDSKVTGDKNFNGIPAHLAMNPILHLRSAVLQREIFDEFGIIAIDHTDRHSPAVLKELLLLLRQGFPKGVISQLHDFKYIYAFAGHDPTQNIAAFHVEAQALSVGGVMAYPESQLSDQQRVDLIAALAHEIGHAFLFQKLTAEELVDAGTRFSGWDEKNLTDSGSPFFSPALFTPHPLKRNHGTDDESIWKQNSIVSEYAMTNLHEWFADSFAADILNKLGNLQIFGNNWQTLLIKKPKNSQVYWTNYNNVSSSFCRWLDSKLK